MNDPELSPLAREMLIRRGHVALHVLEPVSLMPESQLAHEVAELRREIQALRQDLAPVPGLILTGRAALDEFKRLTGGA